jgi:hypothetical protein
MERIYEDAGVRIGSSGPVLAVFWRESPTRDRALQLERAAKALIRRHPTGVSIVVVAHATMGLPPLELRSTLTALLREITPTTRAIAILTESDGLQLSLLRSFLTAVFIVVRPAFRPRWCRSPREAAEHALGALGPVDDARLAALLAELGSALHAAA